MKISHFFRSQGCTTALACCLLCLSFAPAWAAPQKTLYDGAKGTPPGSQGWIFFATGGAETKPQGTGVTTFSTTANRAFQGGYSLVLSSPLDRSRGYTLGFDIQIQAETHVSPDRAGVSVIVLGHDKKGLELGFWPSEVWAQTDKPLFRHGEGAKLDTTARLTHYELRVQGSSYHLLADGKPVLTGPVRDYTAFNGPISPYQTPDFLFFGDDTHAASGAFRLSRVWLRRNSAVSHSK
jgi:hypothetical protein